jgi:GDP-4-dehydro-6-deoxy-D-mannose reductase
MASLVLITGASGFVGGHLAAELAAAGYEVHGLARGKAPEGFPGEWHRGDVGNAASLASIVRELGPRTVFHLPVPGTRAVLDAAGHVVVAGSGAEYGVQPPSRLPVTENAPLNPVTPYGRDKVEQRLLVGESAVYACLFNLLGPRLPDRFAPGSFARQIAEIEVGLRPPVVQLGNPSSTRDWTDIRDAARALRLLAETSAGGPVNVCTGRPVATHDLLQLLISHATVEIEEVVAGGTPSPTDPPEHYGDATRLRKLTGWEPEVPLEQSTADLLDSWRAVIRRQDAS